MVAHQPTTIPVATATVPVTRRIMSVNARNKDGGTRVLRSRGNTTRRRLTRRRPLLPKIVRQLRTSVSGLTGKRTDVSDTGQEPAPDGLDRLHEGKTDFPAGVIGNGRMLVDEVVRLSRFAASQAPLVALSAESTSPTTG